MLFVLLPFNTFSWSLLDPETNFVASELNKKIKSQLPVDNSKAVAATRETFYSFTPYDAAPRGPLHSWFFSGLSTGAASVGHLFKFWIFIRLILK